MKKYVAFDNVQPEILLNKVEKIGVSDTILNFVQHITGRRSIFAEFNMNSPRFSYQVVPQGGVLSPLLFLIHVGDITNGVSKFMQVSQFANDIYKCTAANK